MCCWGLQGQRSSSHDSRFHVSAGVCVCVWCACSFQQVHSRFSNASGGVLDFLLRLLDGDDYSNAEDTAGVQVKTSVSHQNIQSQRGLSDEIIHSWPWRWQESLFFVQVSSQSERDPSVQTLQKSPEHRSFYHTASNILSESQRIQNKTLFNKCLWSNCAHYI